ncbi:TlpA family protein disulfide reductase [Microbacterium radiodurans]|uniref:Thioredoxin family protein n=1 Tax=Microbacterium radiodurans TaxID=661398 RepID=A0A5J5ISK3_9MICO|nr:thioredoxin family protein [Microbacterium radiodurans]KAA9087280.1 thioredoxin family protein [Microbacterium radiodurans]
MDLLTAAIILAVLLTATVILGLVIRWRDGRPRSVSHEETVDPLRLGAAPDALGRTATLLQFSTATCSRCPGVHRLLASLAGEEEGVAHLDVDLTDRPDIARHFNVLQTPTTLVLDSRGVVRTRFGGIPGREVVRLELLRLNGETAAV